MVPRDAKVNLCIYAAELDQYDGQVSARGTTKYWKYDPDIHRHIPGMEVDWFREPDPSELLTIRPTSSCIPVSNNAGEMREYRART